MLQTTLLMNKGPVNRSGYTGTDNCIVIGAQQLYEHKNVKSVCYSS